MASGDNEWVIRRVNHEYVADFDGRTVTWTDEEDRAIKWTDKEAARRILAAMPYVAGERAQVTPCDTRRFRREFLRQSMARAKAVRLLNAEFMLDGSRNPHYSHHKVSDAQFGREVDRLAADILAGRVRIKAEDMPCPSSYQAKLERMVSGRRVAGPVAMRRGKIKEA